MSGGVFVSIFGILVMVAFIVLIGAMVYLTIKFAGIVITGRIITIIVDKILGIKKKTNGKKKKK